MKTRKQIVALCCLGASILLCSCKDSVDMTKIGTSILPPGDEISVWTDTFTMKAQTVRLDSVYAKTTQCLLGEMYDPLYGKIKADFICQFYCEENFKFSQKPHEGKIDSMEMVILYDGSSWFGDSLIPMQASVYAVNKKLKRNFYANDNPADYCNMSKALGTKTYTVYDLNIYDSLPPEGIYYTHYITVKLPQELGQKFYDETVNNPATFSSQETFNEFFSGLYITTTFGSGNLIKTAGENIFLRLYYDYMSKDSLGMDTLVRGGELFASSKEVIQLTRIENDNIDNLLVPSDVHTYVKSPAGVCTKLTIPTREIEKVIDVNHRYINNFSVSLHYLPVEKWDFAYTPPIYLLMIPEDSVKTFFEGDLIEDNKSYFLSYGSNTNLFSYIGVNPTNRVYNFGNISALVKSHIQQSPEKDLNVLLMPVARSYTTQQSGNTLYYITTGIMNSLVPSGVKIRTDGDYMKVSLVSSEFENR